MKLVLERIQQPIHSKDDFVKELHMTSGYDPVA